MYLNITESPMGNNVTWQKHTQADDYQATNTNSRYWW